MKICIPIGEDEGLKSVVHAHFGSAPAFALVDTETEAFRMIPNANAHHQHGMCQPLSVLAQEQIDCVVVGGIGGGALSKMQAAGIRVFLADAANVEATVAALKAGTLQEVSPEMACRGHAAGPHGHCHGHGHDRG
jgi:predicted Fe-Mo cluster-binding NifX family protein